jgi:hypothetical protein
MYLEKKGVALESKDIFGNTPLATAMLNKHSCNITILEYNLYRVCYYVN